MAEVKPFIATFYNQEKVGNLADVICPPYDVVSPSEEIALYQKNPYNFIRLEKAQPEFEDANRDDRYIRTKSLLNRWLDEAILVKNRTPAIYLHDHFFSFKGKEYLRRGLMATVRLEEWNKMIIRPHEGTLAAPKADRIRLLSTLKANTSPVFALYEDRGQKIPPLVERERRKKPIINTTLENGERHIVWEITDAELLNKLNSFFNDRPLYIADGHHRYESALVYKREQEALLRSTTGQESFNFVLMTLVDMADSGLLILPPHRLLRLRHPSLVEDLRCGLEKFFNIRFITYDPHIWDEVDKMFARDEANLAIYGLNDNLLYLLGVKDYVAIEKLMPHFHSEIYKKLDVAIVDHVILGEILGVKDSDPNIDIAFRYDREDALRWVIDGEYQLAILLRSPKIEDIKAIADAGDQMPRKSTYFYPKLPSGLVFYYFG